MLGVLSLSSAFAAVAIAHTALDEEPEPAAASAPHVRTAAWSPRRVPTLVREHSSRAVLTAELAGALDGTDYCVVVSDGAEQLAGLNVDRALIPASAQKVLTGAAALETLGPQNVLTTSVVSAAPIEAGVLSGDLYLVGGADPTLGTVGYQEWLSSTSRYAMYPVTPIEILADEVVAHGITSVHGSVLGDDSRHDRTRYVKSWESNYRTDGETGPLGALVADGGFSAIGGVVGVDDPAAHAASLLVAALQSRGVIVTGGSGADEAPTDASVIGSVDSAPVEAVVAGLVSASHNLSSEVVAREVARASGLEPTTRAGGEAIVNALHDLGVPTEGMVALDGSGLSRGNRVACTTLVATVELTQTGLPELEEALSVAGEYGTLAERYAGDPLAGLLKAKTGNLDGVTALVGLVDAGRRPRFALLANGEFGVETGAALRDSVARAVAAYPAAPPAQELVPSP